jgi:lycopene beta-cyclase
MTQRQIDFAIVGGGLAGGLLALALAAKRPELPVALIEAGPELGGNHRWSWFATDLVKGGEELLAPVRKVEWDGGYDVRFPKRERTLRSAYRSMASKDFAAALKRELPKGAIRTKSPVASLDGEGVTLENGERIAARVVVDCRSAEPSPHLEGGFQVFMGRHIKLAEPHGIERPVIMDATVEQPGAYRFVYVLPLGAYELFIEDTYYADLPTLDRKALSSRIDAYCAAHGWQDAEILGHETGVLPVITGGDLAGHRAALGIEGVVLAGARGGFTHPLTSYTLPFAVETALAIADEADLPGVQLAAMIDARARRHWSGTDFYRMLGKMLFGAAEPEERYKIFERFYGLSEGLIERFHAGRTNMIDRRRILMGKPPVPIGRAMKALVCSQPTFAEAQLEDAA